MPAVKGSTITKKTAVPPQISQFSQLINTPTSPTILFCGVDHFLGGNSTFEIFDGFFPQPPKKNSEYRILLGNAISLQQKKTCRVWKPPFPLKPLTASTSFQPPLPGTIAAESMRAWYDRRGVARIYKQARMLLAATGWMGWFRNPGRKTIPFGMFLKAVVKSMW